MYHSICSLFIRAHPWSSVPSSDPLKKIKYRVRDSYTHCVSTSLLKIAVHLNYHHGGFVDKFFTYDPPMLYEMNDF